jgi:hypothetical protein
MRWRCREDGVAWRGDCREIKQLFEGFFLFLPKKER